MDYLYRYDDGTYGDLTIPSPEAGPDYVPSASQHKEAAATLQRRIERKRLAEESAAKFPPALNPIDKL